jgi:hypothetical protein
MVHFTEDSYVITIPTKRPFQDLLALQCSLAETNGFLVRSAYNDPLQIGNFLPIEILMMELSKLDPKQEWQFDYFITSGTMLDRVTERDSELK